MASVDDGSDVPIYPMPGTSSNYGSLNGSGPDLDGMGHRSIDAQFKEVRDILLPLARGFADYDNHVKTLSEAVGMVTSRIASVEQTVNALSAKMASFAALEQNVSTLTENVSSLTARICKIETNATSVSSGSDSARSWNILGHSKGSTAAGSLGSHGPGSSDDSRNTRRRLDTFSSPEDEQARSAVLLRFPCEQYHKGITKCINNLWEESNMQAFKKPVRIHCKAGSVSVRLVFETRAKCQDFVARYRDDGIPNAIDSPFCCTNTKLIIVRQSQSIEDREIGKQFAPLWKSNRLTNSKFSSLMEMTEGAFLIPALDARLHVLSIKDRRNGVGKPVFKLASLGNGQLFALAAPDLCVPVPEVLQRILSQANKATV